ncbi:hypothetical protein [Methyloligella solikamskensis]|uniref:Beta-lactamase-related domain-containing protein n=1 Tax=Methyloligella solikamskensis TaxID=1177756 RepID=A0ABW3JAN1_9HYPH
MYSSLKAMSFSRGQIEWALAQVVAPSHRCVEEDEGFLKMKIKRLVDLDRKHGIDPFQDHPGLGRFAFFEGKSPGKGHAISYTSYDAFALLIGVQLLDANVPQSAVIRLLRHVRPLLKHAYGEILSRDPMEIAGSKQDLENRIKRGQLATDPSKMQFLVLASGAAAEFLTARANDGEVANFAQSPDELVSVVAHLTLVSPPVLVFEIANRAHQLVWWLRAAPSIQRGRH